MSDSDSDFETAGRQNKSAVGLESAIERARLCIRRHRARKRTTVVEEVRSRFPCHSSPGPSPLSRRTPTKRVKLQEWKVVPVCLEGPHTDRAPTKGVLDSLCRRGLGSKWFTSEDKFAVSVDATAEEFHFAIQCLFPLIKSIPYEFCKATGPGNVILVPLPIHDETMKPTASGPI